MHVNIEFTFSFLLWDNLQSSLDVMCISLTCECARITENPSQQVVPFQNIIISKRDSSLFLSGGFGGIIFLKSLAAPGQCKNTDHQHSVRQNRCADDLWHLNAAYWKCKKLVINRLNNYPPEAKLKWKKHMWMWSSRDQFPTPQTTIVWQLQQMLNVFVCFFCLAGFVCTAQFGFYPWR